MGRLLLLTSALTLLGGVAFAGHAISLEPDSAPTLKEDKAVSPSEPTEPAEEQSTSSSSEHKPAEPEQTASTPAPAPAPIVVPAPKVEVKLPSELDLYMVPAATREVCTTRDWDYGEVETDCRFTPVPVRQAESAPRGVCVTRYGQRICY